MIVNQAPKTSALFRAMYPDDALWGLEPQLLAAIFDTLQAANWQRQGDNRAPRPKPIPRPGVEPQAKRVGGGDAIPMDEMARRLGWEATP